MKIIILHIFRKRKRKVSSSTDGLASDASTPMSTSTPSSSQKFFGPDFNPELVYKATDLESVVEPTSPSMTSSLRKTLDHRRHLVMMLFQENGLFPTNQATSTFQGIIDFPLLLNFQQKIDTERGKMLMEFRTFRKKHNKKP